MAKFEVSEVFMSLEGEAQFTFHPTAYIRFARCNLSCPFFNNPEREKTPTGYAPLTFDPKDYSKLEEIPLITKGCDSQYAVNPIFAHMWKKLEADELVDELLSVIPGNKLVYDTGLPVIVSLTGGEPTLKWKQLPEIMFHEKMKDCKHFLVETNCAVPFKDEFISQIHKWLNEDDSRQWTWSNSPKLNSSGHTRTEAIKPAIALMQSALFKSNAGQINQYFKFVVDGSEEDYAEVKEVMKIYHDAGLALDTPIWIMPQACTQEQQAELARSVARRCMVEGWLYSHRVQNDLWGNGVGT
ncbi:QueE-like queosine biosynthesis protein [Stenotrophomonas phage Mendera]|uniref:QueE-like queosine biosynthesis protein n=1 Tax=Stenotrophomonas phage Mendera TaxID=2650877 RepID=A0A5P8PIN1_9CAUD|nr:QueE-like radical SAM domain [Stenotrophomonas phage Mendera]QFR56592.1 QueE-like queosine biosynthesis protein [Stenotrophomonas phage Mendera]